MSNRISAELERDLPTDQTIPCLKCGGDTVTKMDAIGRTRQRCPRCEGVSPVRPRHPDEALVPQTLVRSNTQRALPPIAEGQLRCQRCARGVVGRARLCRACDPPKGTNQQRSYPPKPCAKCGYNFQPTGPRALWCDRCRP